MRDLNALLPPGEWSLINALAINNAGQILAMSDNAYVLLNPSPLLPPLPAPTGLSSHAGDSVVALSRNTVTVATAYNVKCSTTSGGPYTTIAAGVSGTSYSDRTVVNGILYYYAVTAVCFAGKRQLERNERETAGNAVGAHASRGEGCQGEGDANVEPVHESCDPGKPSLPVIQWRRVCDDRVHPAGLTRGRHTVSSKTPYRYVVTAVNTLGLESPASNAVSAQPK